MFLKITQLKLSVRQYKKCLFLNELKTVCLNIYNKIYGSRPAITCQKLAVKTAELNANLDFLKISKSAQKQCTKFKNFRLSTRIAMETQKCI